jgi:hypothetical protein
MAGYGGSGSEGLLDEMPDFACGVDDCAEDWNYQASAASCYRL